MIKIQIVLIFLCSCLVTFAGKVDSLFTAFDNNQLEDSLRYDAIHKLTWHYIFTNSDSARIYANQHLSFAIDKDIKRQISKSQNNIAISYAIQGNIEEAQNWYNKALKIRIETGDKKGEAAVYNNLGILYKDQNNLSEALEYFHKSLSIHQAMDSKKSVASTTNNIGTIYSDLGKNDKALEYYNLSLKTAEEISDDVTKANTFVNIAIIKGNEKNYPEAIAFNDKAIAQRKVNGDWIGISEAMGNKGWVYAQMHEHHLEENKILALTYLDSSFHYSVEALKIAKKSNSNYEIIANSNAIGNYFLHRKENDSAYQYFNEALSLAKESNSIAQQAKAHHGLYKVYKISGNFKSSIHHLENHKSIEDSLQDIDKQKKLMQQEFQYAFEQKELAAKKEQEKKDALFEAEKQQQKQIQYALISGALMLFAFLIFLYNRFKVTSKQKDIIEDQKFKVEEKESMLREIHEELTDSINYAQKIQQSILKSSDEIKSNWTNSFTIFRPKDIVSGDFYWNKRIEDSLYYSVFDCTGHGVPGGFMSMIGTSELNEIIDQPNTSTAFILGKMRDQIVKTLSQKGREGDSKEGMDGSICRFFKEDESKKVEFSSANNSVYIVRTTNTPEEEFPKNIKFKFQYDEAMNVGIFEFKGIRQPVGYHPNPAPFNDFTLDLKSGDCLYMSSDGYPDQFGGPKGKKFMIKRLKTLLKDIHLLPLSEQQKTVESELKKWMNNFDQIDDICVMCVKIS